MNGLVKGRSSSIMPHASSIYASGAFVLLQSQTRDSCETARVSLGGLRNLLVVGPPCEE